MKKMGDMDRLIRFSVIRLRDDHRDECDDDPRDDGEDHGHRPVELRLIQREGRTSGEIETGTTNTHRCTTTWEKVQCR